MVLPPIDFDGPWKEALDLYLEEALALFFPDAHGAIDWRRGYQPLDKELQQLLPEETSGVQAVDKLVRVWLRDEPDDNEVWVLVHVEVQSQRDTLFAERMFRYHARLYDTYRRRVASFAILGDERPRWRPDSFAYALLGTTLHLSFATAKLLENDVAILEASTNPFATIVLAHRGAQATRHDAERRAVFKFNLTRRLYRLGYGRDEIFRLYHFIDWLLRLPPELEDRVWQQIRTFEEEQAMPHITYAERFGHEQGLVEGRIEGTLMAIATALEIRFGDAGLALLPEIERIAELPRLQTILDRSKTAASPDELRAAYTSGE
jgi:hypothetical protein